jgi:hypothetical protein
MSVSDYPTKFAGLGIGGLPSLSNYLVVIAIASLAKNELRPGRLVERWVSSLL